MNRRDFLKVSGLLSVSAWFAMGPLGKIADLPLEPVANKTIYRGTRSGEIHLSADGGKTWALHTSFGPDCPILNIFTGSNGQVYADVGFKLHHFSLILSQNQKNWLTAPRQISMLDLI